MKINRYNQKLNITGEIIKKVRRKAGLSQEQLCVKIALHGITLYRNDIYRIETNQRTIKDYELIVICKVLKIELNQLDKLIL